MKNDVPDEWRIRQKAGLCPVCGKTKDEFEKGRHTFCSKKCVEEYASKYTFWSVLKDEVLQRDGKICANCKTTQEKEDVEIQKKRKVLLGEWIKNNQDVIKIKRDKQLVELEEEYKQQYDAIMDDFIFGERCIRWDKDEEVFKGLARYSNVRFEVDHRIAVALGGDMWDKNNLQVLCDKCHRQKTNDDLKKLHYHRIGEGNQKL